MSRAVVELGDKVKDKITGLEGIAVSEHKFISGCIQIGVQPPVKKKEGTLPDTFILDLERLEIVDKMAVKITISPTGGDQSRSDEKGKFETLGLGG
jgi:hypothetical protein